MSSLYKNQDSIKLILEELSFNSEFLPFTDEELKNYFIKIDGLSTFEKYYINGNLAGFISFYCNDRDTKEAYITLVLVDQKFRGMKIAKMMLIKVLAYVKDNKFSKCSLEVNRNNLAAINLYKSIGFNEVNINNDNIYMTVLV